MKINLRVLVFWFPPAQVVKLVDTLASGASARKGVEVQVLSWAPYITPPLAIEPIAAILTSFADWGCLPD